MSNLVFNKKNNSMQIVNLIKEKNINPKNNINSIGKFFICPKCNLNIPSLPFFINPIESGSIEILINCKCGNRDRMPLEDYFNFKIMSEEIKICEECNSNKPGLKCYYCINCSKWICSDCREFFKKLEENHKYSEYPIIFSQLCDIHINHENLFYCKLCKKDLCIKCTKSHPKNHKIINLIEYYNKVKESNLIKNLENNIASFFKNNEILKNDCLEILNKIEIELEKNSTNIDFDIKDINSEKEKFLEIYNKNKTLNQQFEKFIHTLHNIFIFANNHPNYNIIHNLEISSFINNNFPNIVKEDKNNLNNYFIESYKSILKYFKENYLLSIKSLVLMKEEKIYLDKYNIKHLLKIDDLSLIYTTDSCFQMFYLDKKEFGPMISEHSKEITRIIKLKNGNVVTGSQDGQIYVWNVDISISKRSILSGHDAEIFELIELSDNNLLSADKTGKIVIWDINKNKQIQAYLTNLKIIAITEMSIFKYFISTNNGFILFHNNKKKIKKTFNNNKIISALFINTHLICSTDDYFLNIYEIEPLQNIKTLTLNNSLTTIKQFNDKYFYGISAEYNLYFFKSLEYEQVYCITIKSYNFYEFLYINNFYAYCGSNNGLSEWKLNLYNLIDDDADNIVLI